MAFYWSFLDPMSKVAPCMWSTYLTQPTFPLYIFPGLELHSNALFINRTLMTCNITGDDLPPHRRVLSKSPLRPYDLGASYLRFSPFEKFQLTSPVRPLPAQLNFSFYFRCRHSIITTEWHLCHPIRAKSAWAFSWEETSQTFDCDSRVPWTPSMGLDTGG